LLESDCQRRLQLAGAKSGRLEISEIEIRIWNLPVLPGPFRIHAEHVDFFSRLRVEHQEFRSVSKIHCQDTICPFQHFISQGLGPVLSSRDPQIRGSLSRPDMGLASSAGVCCFSPMFGPRRRMISRFFNRKSGTKFLSTCFDALVMVLAVSGIMRSLHARPSWEQRSQKPTRILSSASGRPMPIR